MWPRKQLDIGWRDLVFGLSQFAPLRAPPPDISVVPPIWTPPDEVLVSLSVRTGWDLLLTALRLPPTSEIVMSSVTIRDMARIVEHHGLAAVPIDVDAERLEPDLNHLEQSLSPRTRAILVAHLFGSRVNMEPIIRLAKLHELYVIEDCAQAFVGSSYAGHEKSDCSLFSFGPIKTATALGGAILRVRDPDLRRRMVALQSEYPVQSDRAYVRRLLKYATFRLVSKRLPYSALVRYCLALGIDYDEAFSNAAHSFGQSNFFQRIQQRPCVPLVQMLKRRTGRFESHGWAQLQRRAERGVRLAKSLPAGMILGAENPSHTYWALAVRISNPGETLAALRAAGFDATTRSSLVVIPSPPGQSMNRRECASWLAEAIFLPNGDDLPDHEWQRMASLLGQVAGAVPFSEPARRQEVAAPPRISVPS